MTDIDEARAKVRAHLGSDDFELEEFPEGWRVIWPLPEPRRGAATLVVERATGALLSFASAFPPQRLTRNFSDMRSEARVLDGGERTA